MVATSISFQPVDGNCMIPRRSTAVIPFGISTKRKIRNETTNTMLFDSFNLHCYEYTVISGPLSFNKVCIKLHTADFRAQFRTGFLERLNTVIRADQSCVKRYKGTAYHWKYCTRCFSNPAASAKRKTFERSPKKIRPETVDRKPCFEAFVR